LEIQLIDFKSKTERRFGQVFEEMPQQLEREVKRLEMRGAEQHKISGSQMSMASEQLGMMREFIMSQLEQLNEKQQIVKARTDEHELKINMVVRNQDYLKNAAT
jgi:hypothetical protein